MVACSVCGLEYDASARTHRDITAGRVQPRCKLHRTKQRDNTRIAQHRRFWLERFTMDEICFMAACIAPFPSQRAPIVGQALTASAAPPGPAEIGGR